MVYSELTALPDQELLLLVQKDNKAAFSELYNRYWEELINFAGKRMANLSIAEEIVQDVFVDFYVRRKEIQVKTNLLAYLKTAVKFQVFKTYRSKQVQESYLATLVSGEHIRPEQPDSLLEAKQTQNAIFQITESMPPTSRQVFVLSRIEKYSNKDIADQLNISIDMVRKHITKSMNIMRAKSNSLKWMFILFLYFI